MPIIDAGWVTKDGKWVATKDGQRVKCRRKDTTSRERIKKRWEKKLLTQQKVKLKTEAFLWSPTGPHQIEVYALSFSNQLIYFITLLEHKIYFVLLFDICDDRGRCIGSPSLDTTPTPECVTSSSTSPGTTRTLPRCSPSAAVSRVARSSASRLPPT